MNLQQLYEDLSGLNVEDLKQIGSTPPAVRGFVIMLLILVVIGAGGWLFIKPQIDALEQVETIEPKLMEEFKIVYNKAANLEAYKTQLDEMRRSFGAMLRQLPGKTDVESLLVDLSQTSVAAGLEVDFFKPDQEISRDFYAEYPIKLSVTGKYHEFGNFVSGLAALPRIVTLHNIEIIPHTDADRLGQLKMDLTATTYRYLEADE